MIIISQHHWTQKYMVCRISSFCLPLKGNLSLRGVHGESTKSLPLDLDLYPLTSCLSAGTIQNPIYRGKRAKDYPFTLDNFQEISIACLVSLWEVVSIYPRQDSPWHVAAMPCENPQIGWRQWLTNSLRWTPGAVQQQAKSMEKFLNHLLLSWAGKERVCLGISSYFCWENGCCRVGCQISSTSLHELAINKVFDLDWIMHGFLNASAAFYFPRRVQICNSYGSQRQSKGCLHIAPEGVPL